jgi:hypothetical protein
MDKKYLEATCLKTSYSIFQEALWVCGNPMSLNGMEEMKEYIDCLIENYNPVEQEIIKKYVQKMFRDYKNEVDLYSMNYR